MIRGSDGLEYEDLTARLLGEPAKTTRNGNVRSYRGSGYREDAVQAYCEAFDKVSGGKPLGPGPLFASAHKAGIRAVYSVGGFFRTPEPSNGSPG